MLPNCAASLQPQLFAYLAVGFQAHMRERGQVRSFTHQPIFTPFACACWFMLFMSGNFSLMMG